MVENNPEMAKTTGVPLSVAKDFNRADHQRKLAQHLRGKR
jgi:hypothetical protein